MDNDELPVAVFHVMIAADSGAYRTIEISQMLGMGQVNIQTAGNWDMESAVRFLHETAEALAKTT